MAASGSGPCCSMGGILLRCRMKWRQPNVHALAVNGCGRVRGTWLHAAYMPPSAPLPVADLTVSLWSSGRRDPRARPLSRPRSPSRSRTRGSLFAPPPLTGCVVVVFRPTAARRHCIAVPHSRHKRRTWPLLSRPNFPSEKAGVVVVSFLWPAAICSIARGAAIRRRSPLLSSLALLSGDLHTERLAPIEILPRSPVFQIQHPQAQGLSAKSQLGSCQVPGAHAYPRSV